MRMRICVLILLLSWSFLFAGMNLSGSALTASDFYSFATPGSHEFGVNGINKYWEMPSWWTTRNANPCILKDGKEYDTNNLQWSVRFANCEGKSYSYHKNLIVSANIDSSNQNDAVMISLLNKLEGASNNIIVQEKELYDLNNQIIPLRN
ncbi:hypothetical protein J7J26_00250, partial [Candidatus Micrarchaeota archaeon]|nr:hypothetical protein [Candidatus Micrarchaeota archaeon]